MEFLSAYLPVDRYLALAQGKDLPDRVQGCALFADISGFTPLTEALVREFGPLRGAEELTQHLNNVYDALIDELYRYGGSAICFSGDSITCWFDGDTGLRATACALAMQGAMQRFESVQITPEKSISLMVKAAVAAGPARRFLVGNPEIQVIEVLAGRTLERLARTEQHAHKGEVLVDPCTAPDLIETVEYEAWRPEEETESSYRVVARLKTPVPTAPWTQLPPDALPNEVLRPWLLPAVYERILSQKGQFLAEFRPAATVFVRFSGIDYDADDSAGEKLDRYIRQVQNIVDRLEGSLTHLTVGDKGSYFQASFGAPVASENNALRAVSAASGLRDLAPVPEWEGKVQIGIGMGRMRTGAYGGSKRRVYGVLGNEANLSARLMMAASAGQVLVSKEVHDAVRQAFSWETLPPMLVKGRSEPVTAFRLSGSTELAALHPPETKYALPMVGRQAELNLAREKLELSLAGNGHILGIAGEAGMGKSRLITEIVQLARQNGMAVFFGECQSYGTNISYLVWQNIWRGLFEIHLGRPVEENIQVLEANIAGLNPDLLPRLPLLSPVLNLPIPDNDLTRYLEAKIRKASLESLLVDCLSVYARKTPTLLVLENLQWVDPLSEELLGLIGRAVADLPVFLVIAYRPSYSQLPGPLPNFTELRIREFSPQEARQLIQIKLHQLYGFEGALPSRLVEIISQKAEGNPFYLEELLIYLHDLKIDPRDIQALEGLDLPSSLHSLILTRIDHLTESQKITLKVASIIGRIFVAAWLWGAYPNLGDTDQIRADLETLSQTDLTPLEPPEPEFSYLFNQIVTQEVAYDSLPFATRALLHDQLAQFVEGAMYDRLDQYTDFLAFHYGRSNNLPKKIEYLQKAGEAAQANYSNEAAIHYYQSLLPLLSGAEHITAILKLGQVLELAGEWDEVHNLYQDALQQAEKIDDPLALARCQAALGDLLRRRSSYEQAASWLNLAQRGFEKLGDLAGMGKVLHSAGTLAAQRGELEKARDLYEQSLAIRQQLGEKSQIANLKNNLGIVARQRGDYPQARALQLEGLHIRREIGDRFGIAASLNNLGNLELELGNDQEARFRLEEAVKIQREIGSKFYIANALNNLGNVVRSQGDYAAAQGLYRESLEINRALGDGWAISYLLEDMGCLAALLGQAGRALRLLGAASGLRERTGAPLSASEKTRLEKTLASAGLDLDQAPTHPAWAQGREMTTGQAVDVALEDDFML